MILFLLFLWRLEDTNAVTTTAVLSGLVGKGSGTTFFSYRCDNMDARKSGDSGSSRMWLLLLSLCDCGQRESPHSVLGETIDEAAW